LQESLFLFARDMVLIEQSSLLASNGASSLHQALYNACLAASMICFSVGLINFNAWLMQEHRFPYAAALVLLHMAFCSLCALFLYFIKPSCFPSLHDPDRRPLFNMSYFLKGTLPIAIVFSGSLFFANAAYSHLSIAFLQMIKESNMVLVYMASTTFGIEKFTWTQMFLVIAILLATSLTVEGEMHFQLIGFVLQVLAVVCECSRVVLQAALLSGSGKKLDPLSYVLIISPQCTVLLGSLLLGLFYMSDRITMKDMKLPTTDEVYTWWPWLLADCALAFILNLTIAALIQCTSPTAYVGCQIVKDVMAVIVGALSGGSVVSSLQWTGFSLQILFVGLMTFVKTFPDRAHHYMLKSYASLSTHNVHTKKGEGMPTEHEYTQDAQCSMSKA